MEVLERIAYAVARGFARAWYEVQMAARQAEREVPDEEMARVRDNFRRAVDRLRAEQGGDSRRSLPPPPGGGG